MHTATVAVRCNPREWVDDLVEEYGRTNPEIEEAIRWERAHPIAARGVCTVPRGKFAQLPAASKWCWTLVVSSIERQLDHWAAGAPREQWIPEVGQKDWILLSRDQNIRCNELEPRLMAMAKVHEFVILGGNLYKIELAGFSASALPAMQKMKKPSFIVSISKSAHLGLRYPRVR